jgi:hypothetical protein
MPTRQAAATLLDADLFLDGSATMKKVTHVGIDQKKP